MAKSTITRKTLPRSTPKTRAKALPEAVLVSAARPRLSNIVQACSTGQTIYLGASQATARSMFAPPAAAPARKPTVVHSIKIESLRKRLKTVREEVENTGVEYAVLVNDREMARLRPTKIAFDTKIKRAKANLGGVADDSLGADVVGLRKEITALRKVVVTLTTSVVSLVEERSEITRLVNNGVTLRLKADSEDLRDVLHYLRSWVREWRKNNGLPPLPEHSA